LAENRGTSALLLSELKTEFARTVEDLSQYLKYQDGLGNRDFGVSKEARAAMDKWGTPQWQSQGFFTMGPKSAGLMIVDSQGSFFNGPAGELLTKILKAMRLTPSKVFICNTADLSQIRAHVRNQPPKCLLCLGGKAGRLLLNRRDKISDFRGQFLTFENTPLLATHHPQALIKTPELKRQVWDDVQQVMVLGL